MLPGQRTSARNCAAPYRKSASSIRRAGAWWASGLRIRTFARCLLGEGRLITDDDERDGNRVVILGSAARRQLFPGQPAVGSSVLIKSVPYTVIGVLEEKKQNSNYDGPDNDYLFAPTHRSRAIFPRRRKKA